jgi:hypothetical protein
VQEPYLAALIRALPNLTISSDFSLPCLYKEAVIIITTTIANGYLLTKEKAT